MKHSNCLCPIQDPSLDPIATNVPLAAAKLIARGYAVCRVEPGAKQPVYGGWPTRSLTPDEFQADNVGIICGPLSAPPGFSLVCVDLDSAPAVALADTHLPATGMIDGRASKPRSRWVYRVRNESIPGWAQSKAEQAAPAAVAKCGHPGPFKKCFKDAAKKVAIDFIGTGGQFVVPPSLHASGERRAWEGGTDEPGEPAEIDFVALWDAVGDLAEAAGAWVAGKIADEATEDGATEGHHITCDVAMDPPATADGRLENPHAVHDNPAELLARAAGYVATMDLPRTGRAGDPATYRILGTLLYGFAFPREVAFDLFGREVNAKLRAMGDAWERAAIERKIDRLILRGPDAGYGPVGKLREAPEPGKSAPTAWNDGDRLAASFAKDRHGIAIKDTVATFGDGAYTVVSAAWLDKEIREHVLAARDREHARRTKQRADTLAALTVVIDAPDLPADTAAAADVARQNKAKADAVKAREKLEKCPTAAPEPVTTRLVAEARAALKAKWQRPDTTEPNTWLRGSGPRCLSVANGLLDLETLALRPHTPDYYTLTRIDAPFDPDAPAPSKFLATLDDLLEGDAERIARLREVFGACLDPWGGFKFFACLVGPPDCGKSVVGSVLRALLGAANVSAVDLAQIAGSQFGTWPLYGKLLNLVGDQSAIDLDNVGLLKTLTGGDVVKYEQKGRDPIFGACTAKLVYSCNEPPALKDRTDATWRRLEVVVFRRAVPRDKQDSRLQDSAAWAPELAGILNWSLDGLKRLRANRGQFTRSAMCDAVKEENRLASDPTRAFVVEHLEAGSEIIPSAQLYDWYTKWASSNGLKHPLASNAFGRVVGCTFPGASSDGEWVGEGSNRKKVRCWSGIRVREGMHAALGISGPTFLERMERMGTDTSGSSVPH